MLNYLNITMEKTKKRRWNKRELAYLKGNLGGSNIKLSADMGRSIESIESMKRNLRNKTKDVEDFWFDAYMHKKPDYISWMTFTDTYLTMNRLEKLQERTLNEGVLPKPTYTGEEALAPRCDDTIVIKNKMRYDLSKDEINDRRRFMFILVMAAIVIGALFLIYNFSK